MAWSVRLVAGQGLGAPVLRQRQLPRNDASAVTTTAPPATPKPRPKPRLVFPKRLRVLDRRDFQRIQSRGMRLGGHLLLIMAFKQQGAPKPARLGITASRKSGESVQRSRIKRILREAFRLHPGIFPPGVDIVVIAREGADVLTLAEATAELKKAAARLTSGPQRGSGGGGPHRPGGPRRPAGPHKPQQKS